MKKLHLFHLLPEQEVCVTETSKFYPYSQNKILITGIRKMLEYGTDEKGNYYWDIPTLIAIIKAKRYHNCTNCCTSIERKEYFVGLCQSDCIPYWGADDKLCIKCAIQLLGNKTVYPCQNEFCGHNPAPIILESKPFLEYLNLFIKEKTK